MSKNNAYQFLIEAKEQIGLLKEKGESSFEYQEWKECVEAVIRKEFGENSTEYQEFHRLLNPLFIGNSLNMDFREQFIRQLENASHKLSGIIAILSMRQLEDIIEAPTPPVTKASIICSRFSNAIRHLRKRFSDRPALTVEDEYDVQYLLKILLSVAFDDIRPEEPTPSCAGSSSRIDFLLKNEGIAIETKMTRCSLTDKKLGEELILDVAYYKSHPNVSSLICFVYDPKRFIENPQGLIRDIEDKSDDKLFIKVIISP